MAKYFTNIPLQPENLESLRDAIIRQVLEDEDFRKYVTIKKVRNGEPLAIIGEMDAVGHAGAGCSPTFEEIGIANELKRWALGAWSIALEICYTNLEETIAEYCLKAGTEIGDLSDTDFMAIYVDLLSTQMRRMIWRLAWFGDTAADTIANGGVLTNGTDKTLFTANNGFFKQLFAIGTADATKVTPIAANSQTTYAAQIAAIKTAGVATTLVDDILFSANARINQNGRAMLMLNKRFADALTLDIKKTYMTIMPWERVFEGFEVAQYNGVTIASIATWDYMINQYEDTGAKWNKPFRAVFANPENLVIGCDANDPISDLDIWFEKKERKNMIYATGKLDTKIAQDDLVHMAY